MSHTKHMSGGFVVIIVFKFFKAALFTLVASAALHYSRLATMPTVAELAHFFRVTSENEIIQHVAQAIRDITPGQAAGLALISLLAAAVFAAEGLLLSFRVWWSTYLTVLLTALGIPLELFEILQRPRGPRRYVLLLINVAILIYLWRRRNEFRHDPPWSADSRTV